MSKITKKNLQEAYKQLSDNHVHWGRTDSNTIYVWTSGYVTSDAHDIEVFLNKFGMQAISQDFDKMCGKTKTVFKHK